MAGLLNDLLLDPLAYPFMQRAILIALAVATVTALLSCFLVLRGWSLMGDAIAHAVLPGIVLAFLANIPLVLGAFAAGLSCAVATRFIHEGSRIKQDTALGIVFSGLFALGLVLFTKVETDQHLNHVLFGNMLGASLRDLLEVIVVAVPVALLVVLRRRDLLLITFDPVQARVLGLPVARLELALLAGLAATIVVAIKAVGVVLVVALLIGPGASAFLLTRRFDRMLGVALGAAMVATVGGAYLSFHLDWPTGPTIVLVQAALFVLALVTNLGRGGTAQRRSAHSVADGSSSGVT